MQESDKIKEYLRTVCEQIRWKKAHGIISKEIEDHIIDQKDAFMKGGLDESSATNKAIVEMGDPILIGTELDRTHRPKTEWSMIILTIVLSLIGLGVNFFITPDLQQNLPTIYFTMLSATFIGLVCMVTIYFIDFTLIGKHPKILFILLITLIVILFSFGSVVNGARQWITIMGIVITLRPFISLIPIAYTGIIYSMRNKGYLGLVYCGTYYVAAALICLSQGNLSSIAVCTLTCLFLITFSVCSGHFNIKRRTGILLIYVPTLAVIFTCLLKIFMTSYRVLRFEIWLNPAADPLGRGYQLLTLRNILSTSKFLGQGEVQPYAFHPPDYIITHLINRIGWISLIIILIPLSAFIIRGFYLCSKQKSVLGQLVSTSVLLVFTTQIFIYMTANLGFPIFHSNTLPFISYGGTSTIINLILVGILLSVFRSDDLVHDNQNLIEAEKNKFLEIIDGKIIIDLRARTK